MATISGISLSTPRPIARSAIQKPQAISAAKLGMSGSLEQRLSARRLVAVRAAPDQISKKVEESVKQATETCADDPASGECVAAWDEVEELSAAASHARDKQKLGENDPLEKFCKDNPEDEECRTYDN